METKDYCPIKNKDGTCGADDLECNHINCVEKIRYIKPTEASQKKYKEWASHRRGDLRWEDKIKI